MSGRLAAPMAKRKLCTPILRRPRFADSHEAVDQEGLPVSHSRPPGLAIRPSGDGRAVPGTLGAVRCRPLTSERTHLIMTTTTMRR